MNSNKRYFIASTAYVVAIVLVILAADYIKFSQYKLSRFFGSKDTYSQNQSLFFDDIKVTVTEVEHKEHANVKTYEECSSMPNTITVEFHGVPQTIENFSKDFCFERTDKYGGRKQVIVHYFIENLRNKPISIGPYSVRVDGSSDIQRNWPDPKITDLLAKQSRYANFWLDVPKEADDFALVITKDGKQKQIKLALPELQKSEQ